MLPFRKLASLKIHNPQINIKNTRGCFLYDFKGAGFSEKRFLNWLEGRAMDIYQYTGRFGKLKVCSWCKKEHDVREHDKTLADVVAIKLSQKAYPLLLQYVRNGNYQALGFLMHLDCQYCLNPVVKGRGGKCSIPSATRNRFRSLKVLGLTFDNFQSINYPNINNIAIIF